MENEKELWTVLSDRRFVRIISDMDTKKENLLAVLSARRLQNFKNQFKSVVLEGLEIFGLDAVQGVYDECMQIWDEFITLESSASDSRLDKLSPDE